MPALIPQLIGDAYQQQQRAGQFAAFALFVDISGFTKLTETLMQYQKDGAEILTAALNRIFQPLVTAVYSRGGFITNFAGDAFTALFPYTAPASSNDALAAVGAALFIRQFFTTSGLISTPYGDFQLAVKVGIAMGDSDWGMLGTLPDPDHPHLTDGRATFFFRGTAVDTCAAAEHHADKGNIIIAHTVLPFLGDTVQYAPLPTADDHSLLLDAAHLPAPPYPPVADIPRDVLAPFVLNAVLDLTAGNVRGEFRHIAVAFLSFNEPPDDARLNAFTSTVLDLTYSYGGYFNKIDFGDKGGVMLMLFGAPVAHENTVERATDFLLALRQHDTAVAWRAGLTSGVVYAGILGGNERHEYTAIGDVVNLAARLMMHAPWGAVWLSEPVAHELQAANYQTKPLGDFTFKGKSNPVPVWQLVGRSDDTRSQLYAGPLVGRSSELRHMRQWADPILRGTFAGFLTIYGDAGMGKSRLAYALQDDLQQQHSVKWLYCPTDEVLRQSLNPFEAMLRSYFEQSVGKPPMLNRVRFELLHSRLVQRVAQHNEGLAREIERTRPFLGALLNLRYPGSLYEQLEPRLRFENTLLALVALLQGESLLQPLVLQIEDLHWLDNDSLTLLAQISRQCQGYPLAVLLTSRYRDDGSYVPLELAPAAPATLIDLATFTADGVREFATYVLDGAVSPTLVQFLLEKTSGNPFFIEQLVLDLRERAIIAHDDNGVWTVQPQDVTDLPTSINGVLVARLDRLPIAVRLVVQTASVLGREFDMPVLLAMLAQQQHAAQLVATASSERIWSAAGEVRLLFRHALLRDAAYDMQLRARLRELHAAASTAILQVYRDELPPHYVDLAYHYGRAKDVPNERQYAGLAGEWAAGRYANAEAITYLSRALDLTDADAAPDRYHLLLTREQVYDRQGERDEQARDLDLLTALAHQLHDPLRRAEVGLRHAHMANVTGDYPAALEAAGDVLADPAMLTPELQAQGALRRAFAYQAQGDYPAADVYLQRTLDIAHAATLPTLEAEALWLRGRVGYLQGDLEPARTYAEQALALYQHLADKPGQAQAYNLIGSTLDDLGEYEQARGYYQQALALHQATGNRYGEGIVLHNIGKNLWLSGAYADAEGYYQQSLDLCRAIEDVQGIAEALNSLGTLYLDTGSYSRSLVLFREALHLSQEIGDQWGAASILDNLGLLYHYLGSYDDAHTCYQQARTIRATIGDRAGMLRLFGLLGFLSFAQRTYEQALDMIEQALQPYRAGDDESDPREAAAALKYLGHVESDLRMAHAPATYQQARALLVANDLHAQIVEVDAALARLALQQDNTTQALQHVEAALQVIAQNPELVGTDEPFRVYLNCYETLWALDDPRARAVLQQGYTLLQQRAERIDDPVLRHSYLHTVFHHRVLLAHHAFQQRLQPS